MIMMGNGYKNQYLLYICDPGAKCQLCEIEI